MENCTIYSAQYNFDKVEAIIRAKLPKADIQINDGGTQKQLVANIKGGLFKKAKTLKISYRQRATPANNLAEVNCALSQNLAGMSNFINTFPTSNPTLKNALLEKVASCNSEIPFLAEPKLDNDFKAILLEITTTLDAIVFAQPNSLFTKARSNHFTDKNLNLILDQEGRSELSSI